MDICTECGRKLRTTQSREVGYGPVCYKKIFGTSLRISDEETKIVTPTNSIPYYEIPGQMSIEDFLGGDEN